MKSTNYPSTSGGQGTQALIIGIGELLWDVFPDGARLGGAPANFATHCNRLGARAFPVSCVGLDVLGERAVEELKALQVDTSFIAAHRERETGTVQVRLDSEGKPSYQIEENVAWDHIEFTEVLKELAKRVDAVCFGTLGQRSQVSREGIQSFVRSTPPDALRIFDVNLRQDCFSKALIEESLKLANVLKVSDEELPVLAGMFKLLGDVENQLGALRERFSLDLVAYTRGGDGSLLYGKDQISDSMGIPVAVVDSVGAGDSFTATLCTSLLKGWSLDRVNAYANEVAAYVCSQKGATPQLPNSLLANKPSFQI